MPIAPSDQGNYVSLYQLIIVQLYPPTDLGYGSGRLRAGRVLGNLDPSLSSTYAFSSYTLTSFFPVKVHQRGWEAR
jgi:hypothetical protein